MYSYMHEYIYMHRQIEKCGHSSVCMNLTMRKAHRACKRMSGKQLSLAMQACQLCFAWKLLAPVLVFCAFSLNAQRLHSLTPWTWCMANHQHMMLVICMVCTWPAASALQDMYMSISQFNWHDCIMAGSHGRFTSAVLRIFGQSYQSIETIPSRSCWMRNLIMPGRSTQPIG